QDPAGLADPPGAVRHPVPPATDAETYCDGDRGAATARAGDDRGKAQAPTAAANAESRGKTEGRAGEKDSARATAGEPERAGAREGPETAQSVQGRARRPASADGSHAHADEESIRRRGRRYSRRAFSHHLQGRQW